MRSFKQYDINAEFDNGNQYYVVNGVMFIDNGVRIPYIEVRF
jgi:hypothetical protein